MDDHVCSQHSEFSKSIGHLEEAVGEIKSNTEKTHSMIAENRDMIQNYMVRQDVVCERISKVFEGNGEKPLVVRLARRTTSGFSPLPSNTFEIRSHTTS